MVKKARIVEITHVDGVVTYAIEQRHFLFRWWWVPAWMNNTYPYASCSFLTLAEAQKNMCYYDGSKSKIKVIQ